MNKSKLKKIKEIEKRVPQEWRDSLMEEVYVAPDVRNEAIATLKEYEEEIPNLKDEDLKIAIRDQRRLQNMFDAGYYDVKEMRVNKDVAKKIEDFIEEEIIKAIDSGELPKPKSDREFNSFVKKLHKTNDKSNKKSNLHGN